MHFGTDSLSGKLNTGAEKYLPALQRMDLDKDTLNALLEIHQCNGNPSETSTNIARNAATNVAGAAVKTGFFAIAGGILVEVANNTWEGIKYLAKKLGEFAIYAFSNTIPSAQVRHDCHKIRSQLANMQSKLAPYLQSTNSKNDSLLEQTAFNHIKQYLEEAKNICDVVYKNHEISLDQVDSLQHLISTCNSVINPQDAKVEPYESISSILQCFLGTQTQNTQGAQVSNKNFLEQLRKHVQRSTNYQHTQYAKVLDFKRETFIFLSQLFLLVINTAYIFFTATETSDQNTSNDNLELINSHNLLLNQQKNLDDNYKIKALNEQYDLDVRNNKNDLFSNIYFIQQLETLIIKHKSQNQYNNTNPYGDIPNIAIYNHLKTKHIHAINNIHTQIQAKQYQIQYFKGKSSLDMKEIKEACKILQEIQMIQSILPKNHISQIHIELLSMENNIRQLLLTSNNFQTIINYIANITIQLQEVNQHQKSTDQLEVFNNYREAQIMLSLLTINHQHETQNTNSPELKNDTEIKNKIKSIITKNTHLLQNIDNSNKSKEEYLLNPQDWIETALRSLTKLYKHPEPNKQDITTLAYNIWQMDNLIKQKEYYNLQNNSTTNSQLPTSSNDQKTYDQEIKDIKKNINEIITKHQTKEKPLTLWQRLTKIFTPSINKVSGNTEYDNAQKWLSEASKELIELQKDEPKNQSTIEDLKKAIDQINTLIEQLATYNQPPSLSPLQALQKELTYEYTITIKRICEYYQSTTNIILNSLQGNITANNVQQAFDLAKNMKTYLKYNPGNINVKNIFNNLYNQIEHIILLYLSLPTYERIPQQEVSTIYETIQFLKDNSDQSNQQLQKDLEFLCDTFNKKLPDTPENNDYKFTFPNKK